VIPESGAAGDQPGRAAVHMEGSDVSEALQDVIDRFLGDLRTKPLQLHRRAKPGFQTHVLGK
jgi:septum site-determining protein MinD